MAGETTGGYAGDLSPQEAWSLLSSDADAVLVDVRSQPEWSFVGLPDLSSIRKQPVRIPWQNWTVDPTPRMIDNPNFAMQLEATGVPKTAPMIFICRSGGRSKAAAIAMTARGYRRCYNLTGGFEGPHDSARHRGAVSGWKAAGLPWTQD
ncbi:MAG TPA: rhodanese-like domain-containing protein [Alphaproteobacteria bacterium]